MLFLILAAAATAAAAAEGCRHSNSRLCDPPAKMVACTAYIEAAVLALQLQYPGASYDLHLLTV